MLLQWKQEKELVWGTRIYAVLFSSSKFPCNWTSTKDALQLHACIFVAGFCAALLQKKNIGLH